MDRGVGLVCHSSSSEATIALYRLLFRGRVDVYPRRFDSGKTGKSGYAPACANERVRGICEKPRIKCADCVVDECHHLSAHSFEQVTRQAKARFVAGLSATVARKDGHHPITFMQCGPVRHRVNAKAQAAARPFDHFVLVQPTAFQRNRNPDRDKRVEFQALYQELVADELTRTPSVRCGAR